MATIQKTTYRVKEIDWDNLINTPNIEIPLTVTVTALDLRDPLNPTSTSVSVDVVTTLMMRNWLVYHYDWKWLAPVIGQGDWATLRFVDLWQDFVAHKSDQVAAAVEAMCVKYVPNLTYWKHEEGDLDKITYNSDKVNNSNAVSNSNNRSGSNTNNSYGSPGTDGYVDMSIGTSTTTGTNITTTVEVSPYDDEAFSNQTKSTNTGDTTTISGSKQSAKESHTGNDTHERSLDAFGSDALHTAVEVIKQELELRMQTDIGKQLMKEFADEYFWMADEYWEG